MVNTVDIKWLEDFVCLSKSLNFSAAAKERNVTQPAFSRRIRSLENYLGVPLFDRSSTPIVLTLYGQHFITHAEDVLDSIRDARQELALLAPQANNIISMISLHTLAINVLPNMIGRIKDRVEQLEFVVNPSIQGVDNHYTALLDNQIDVLVTYEMPEYRLSAELDRQFERLLWSTDRFIPVISQHLYDKLGRSAAKTLPYLHYSEYTFTNSLIAPLYQKVKGELHCVYESTLSESINNMVLNQVGMAWLPFSMVAERLASGELIQLWRKRASLTKAVNIVLYRNKSQRRAEVELFWQAVKASLPETSHH
jgi:DNA-binding transcriptional LysR family regulator